MVKYILKRIGFLLLTLFLVASITFFLMKALPGTPFNNPKIPADQLEILKRQYGLDKPVWIQYLTYMVGITHGDFGMSYQFPGQTVSNLIVSRLGPSLQIGAQAMVLGTLSGLCLVPLRQFERIRPLMPKLQFSLFWDVQFLTLCLLRYCSCLLTRQGHSR